MVRGADILVTTHLGYAVLPFVSGHLAMEHDTLNVFLA